VLRARASDAVVAVLGMGVTNRAGLKLARAPTNKVAVSGETATAVGAELHNKGGWPYRSEMVDCGEGATGRCRKCSAGPRHGPNWYRYHWCALKMHKRHVGKNLPSTVLRDADRASNSVQSSPQAR
jgi:hypothetical protein